MDIRVVFLAFCAVFVTVGNANCNDIEVMTEFNKGLNERSADFLWVGDNCCNWTGVKCSGGSEGDVIEIRIKNQVQNGTLPQSLNKLKSLQIFEVQHNNISGPLPSFSGLNFLKSILLNDNKFTSIPPDFFNGLPLLETVYLDNNTFDSWSIPDGLQSAGQLGSFSANWANISGHLPNFWSNLSSLQSLNLAFNYLVGPLPSSLAGSQVRTLWLNDQQGTSKLNGPIDVLQNMTELTQVWLHGNSFSGPLPDFSGLTQLKELRLNRNMLTGPVPDSLVNMPSLSMVILTGNKFQGKFPNFSPANKSDLVPNQTSMNFCLQTPGQVCDQRVTMLLDVSQAFGYPLVFADSWKGNDPCSGSTTWLGISCNNNGNITVVNFKAKGLTGNIPRSFSNIKSLQALDLSNNNLTGDIPWELTTLPNLTLLDVSNNQLSGKIPDFRKTVTLKTGGNIPPPPPPGAPGSSPASGDNNEKKNHAGLIVGIVTGVVLVCLIIGMVVLCRRNRKLAGKSYSPYNMFIHPRSGSEDQLKVGIADSTAYEETKGTHQGNGGPSDLHIVDTGNMVISIEVLRNVTNNFSESNILGRGGFGTVYEGVLRDGTKIAVKRMESNVMTEKGLEEFKSEISVLTKVRHRHLVALLGYCLEGNERLLVYEHMPQGTLSRFLFGWKSEGLKPLEWAKRLTIVLDVARGVEYLHSLAQQSFIHRDLKPSNILLGDDMRAKVADFGLVRLAPDGQASVATKLAGTFGYLAPEYAVTGKVTTKIDVYSFGVILMELITGRKALDESLEDNEQHLVPWFRRMLIKKDTFVKAIDPSIDPDEETLASIITIAELAGHCTARDPGQRPDMGHAVNVISSLVELWRPSEPADAADLYGIDYNMSLPQAIMKWQALEGMTGIEGPSHIGDNSDSSYTIPTGPSGFANGFASTEGR